MVVKGLGKKMILWVVLLCMLAGSMVQVGALTISESNSVPNESIIQPLGGGSDLYNLENGMESKGDYLFIAEGTYGIEVYSTSSGNAVKVNSATIASPAGYNVSCLKVVNNTLYAIGVSGTTAKLLVYDITDPEHPGKGGTAQDGLTTIGIVYNGFRDMDGNQNTLVIANGTNNFKIIDIRDRLNPVSITDYQIGFNAQSVEVKGNYAFVGCSSSNQGFKVFNITDPQVVSLVTNIDSAPASSGVANLDSTKMALDNERDILYLTRDGTSSSSEIYICLYDISDPTQPTFLKSILTYKRTSSGGSANEQSQWKNLFAADGVLYACRYGSATPANAIYPINIPSDISTLPNQLFVNSTSFAANPAYNASSAPLGTGTYIGTIVKVRNVLWAYYFRGTSTRLTDASGNTITSNNGTKLIKIDPNFRGVEITSPVNNARVNSSFTITGTSVGADKISLTVGAAGAQDVPVNADGTWSYNVSSLTEGNITIAAKVKKADTTLVDGTLDTRTYTVVPVSFTGLSYGGKSYLQPGALNVSINATNCTGGNKDATLVVALYNGNQLAACDYQTKTLTANQQDVPLTISLTVPNETLTNYQLKVFTWDNTDAMQPYPFTDTLLPQQQ